ncbi:exported hypothetical protein [Candidatus Terasakiella magnetica]|uniref:Lipoprotein n=1 Tax=Candidatus Terasakiella magnetica TaxID=1867952 RepID=A0A1C3RJ72_9PROT|nr:hypothetical protein [Candidatus Terasakiella magnetica]SCA57321.1 exported hypothetical protein [Candidatus Terasakiella magnetica]
MRLFAAISCLLILSACATDHCGVKTVSGRCLGSGEYQYIDIEESRLTSIPDIKKRIKKVKARSLHSHYQEVVYLNNGVFLAERYYRGGFYDYFSDDRFRKFAAAWTVIGKKIDPDELKTIHSKEAVTYALFNRANKQCIFGRTLFGHSVELEGGSGKQALLTGFICVPENYDKDILAKEYISGVGKVKLKANR